MIWVLVTRFHPFLLHPISAALLFLWLYFAFESHPGFVQYELQGPSSFFGYTPSSKIYFSISIQNIRAFNAKNFISLLGKHSSNSDLDHWMCSTFFDCFQPRAMLHSWFTLLAMHFLNIYEAKGFTCKTMNIHEFVDSLSKRWSFTKIRSNVLVQICLNWLISTLI